MGQIISVNVDLVTLIFQVFVEFVVVIRYTVLIWEFVFVDNMSILE